MGGKAIDCFFCFFTVFSFDSRRGPSAFSQACAPRPMVPSRLDLQPQSEKGTPENSKGRGRLWRFRQHQRSIIRDEDENEWGKRMDSPSLPLSLSLSSLQDANATLSAASRPLAHRGRAGGEIVGRFCLRCFPHFPVALSNYFFFRTKGGAFVPFSSSLLNLLLFSKLQKKTPRSSSTLPPPGAAPAA